MKTIVQTVLALIAFAANSVLCRLALAAETIDALSFTAIRLLSGVLVLFAIIAVSSGVKPAKARGSWTAGIMLFLYAISFSLAYINLDTGTGALILFASVQLTIIMTTLFSGTRLKKGEWLGVLMAFTGFVFLILPGVGAPSPMGFLLMAIAGAAWGIYTLQGRGCADPLSDTAYNFIRTLPFVLILIVIAVADANLSVTGIILAMLSGGIASGVGYSIWYAALKNLSATQAAVVQLSVPVIAAMGGVLFVGEPLTLRLVLATAIILSGIAIVIWSRYRIAPESE
ncbi:MAG: DMT family transporter [Gammaproteobacteria bacterium]|nr:DMT family transporter [Gammaproteobacteria bacterium]MDD9894716.1 DMT family transporter [Gammaproteobacteria bacterium]MDD9957390.1 DMT family transporter [Gammaproteobacteria bacterium]